MSIMYDTKMNTITHTNFLKKKEYFLYSDVLLTENFLFSLFHVLCPRKLSYHVSCIFYVDEHSLWDIDEPLFNIYLVKMFVNFHHSSLLLTEKDLFLPLTCYVLVSHIPVCSESFFWMSKLYETYINTYSTTIWL